MLLQDTEWRVVKKRGVGRENGKRERERERERDSEWCVEK